MTRHGVRTVKRIAFVSDSLSSITGFPIFLINADGNNIQILPIDPGTGSRMLYWGFQPDWSPDGSRSVFISKRDHRDLYVMDSDGNNVQRLTAIGDVWGFNWNSTGEFLAFLEFQRSEGKRRLTIYLIGADGSNLQQLPDAGEDVFGLAWDKEGKPLSSPCFPKTEVLLSFRNTSLTGGVAQASCLQSG